MGGTGDDDDALFFLLRQLMQLYHYVIVSCHIWRLLILFVDI